MNSLISNSKSLPDSQTRAQHTRLRCSQGPPPPHSQTSVAKAAHGGITWISTRSRSVFSFACSDIAVQIGAEMFALLSKLGVMVFDPAQDNLPKGE